VVVVSWWGNCTSEKLPAGMSYSAVGREIKVNESILYIK
jgi:hypothetical protein